MDIFLEILKFTIPALIVFLTAWLLLRNVLQQQNQTFALFIGKEIEQSRADLKSKSKEITLPVRLQGDNPRDTAHRRSLLLPDASGVQHILSLDFCGSTRMKS